MAYLALDLGAGSGRAIVGEIIGGYLRLTEVHRFENTPVQIGKTLYWDFPRLFANVKEGIRSAVREGYRLDSVAVDAWGVDFGLIDRHGRLLSNPVCYRDARTRGMSEKTNSIVPAADFYAVTGIQQMDINTVYQLRSMVESDDGLLKIADRMLFMPDLINYYLTGNAYSEYTIASTSQMLDARTRRWSTEILERMGIPNGLTAQMIDPGTVVGKLTEDIAAETGAGRIDVCAAGSHDTASAIAAIAADGCDWAFLSSGTWSLLGVLNDAPVLSPDARRLDFTNEGGVDGKILFLRNMTGLWLVQRLKQEWEKEGYAFSYDTVLHECAQADPLRSIVDPDAPCFNHPVSMTEAIQRYCESTGQPVPRSKGELIRCVLESLAIKYGFVFDSLRRLTSMNLTKLHIVGGGSKNELLNQYVADALNVEVITGLAEGTAVGNIVQQAVAAGEIADFAEAGKVIKRSFPIRSYFPSGHDAWRRKIDSVGHLFD